MRLMATYHVFKPAERPLAEVLVDGMWRPAEIRMWTRADDGSWTANVSWSSGPTENRLDNFSAELLRPLHDPLAEAPDDVVEVPRGHVVGVPGLPDVSGPFGDPTAVPVTEVGVYDAADKREHNSSSRSDSRSSGPS